MKKHFLIFTVFSCLLFSCEEEKNAKIEVWLTDAPGDFQEVNIDLQAVEVHSNETAGEQGWKSLEITQGTYDLLKLTNGKETLLGDLELPGGRISQIRLKLGENNEVKVDDQVFSLSTPSAQQSGLKIKINEVLAEGITYKILLDFDAAKSIVQTGTGTYSLKPVIRALTKAQDGVIKGLVNNPAETQVSISVYLDDATEPTTTSSNDETGNFLIRGLAAGTYRVVFEGSTSIEKTDVEVELGVVTDLGTVDIPE